MKTKFTKKGRRILSAALCLLMMITALPMSAFAWTSEEGKRCTSSFGDYYVGSDGEYYRSKATYSFIVYDSKGNITVQSINAGNAKRKYLMTDNSGTHQVYCVESGVDFNTGNSYVSKSGKNSSYFQNLPTDAQFGIMMALMYGWHEGKSSPVAGTNADDYAFATQTIIWEYQQQLRTSPSNRQSANGIDGDTYYYSLKGRPAEKCYDWILSQMSKHYTIPSFAARSQSNADTYTLKYNPDTKKYSLTLEDTNNTLSDIKFSASGISVTRSGNKYTFTSDKMITSPVTVSAQKNVNLDCGEMLIWGCVGKQTMVSGASDPVYFYLKIDTETYGTGQIKKTSEDGVVSGISFNISGNGVNKTVTTGADGTVDVQLMPGVYTVTEQSIDRYEPQSVQRVTIVSGHTATVTFNNTLKRGSLEIIKNSEDNLVEGVKFHLYGTSLSGLPVDEYAVTDENGVARFENVLISGETPYTVEEVDTAIRYVVPESQTAPIEWEKVTSRSFTNILKKFNVTVTKSDVETGTAQGDASLAGAVYGIYKGEELIDTYTTDENGQFTTDYYICDDDWTVREISPSEGYLLDTAIHHIGAEPELYTVERNSTANDVNEQIIKGNIAIIKHTDDGETQIETPETGATFEVYLKAAGSYDAAKETERDILTCDENGFAQTKDLPYGVYVVEQTSGWEGRELMKPFEVFISKDGQTYRYLINNANFESYIKIVKKDAETDHNVLNNSATYGGNDIFVYDGEVDYSSNWWGSNQKPDNNRIFVHIGSLTLDNWVIMSLDAVTNTHIVVALNKLTDNSGNIYEFNSTLPTRTVYFSSDYGIIAPLNTSLENNKADAYVVQNETTADFNIYARIDNQLLDLTLRNNNTQLVMDDVVFYGNNNNYEITLINVNGHKIFNQTLTVVITTPKGEKEYFTLVTDEKGHAKFEVTYPVGVYNISVYYDGNGYFEGCNKSAKIDVQPSATYLISYNYTFYGKNVNFYAVLSNGQVGIVNQSIKITIIDSKGGTRTAVITTDSTGRADAILSLDVGKYIIKCEYGGDGWYLPSSSVSDVEIRPVNSTIEVPDVTFYGIGNEYNITLKDAHGTLIRGEYIKVVLTQGDLYDVFILQTGDDGVARLTINYLPGTYQITASYAGDNVYGFAKGSGTIVVNKVLTVISGFHYIKIPLNGVYSVVLTDMFGHRVNNATIKLNIYKGSLLKTYIGVTDGNGEVTFRISQSEGTYLATFDFDGDVWYIDSTGAATIVVDSKTAPGHVSINASDLW